MFKSLVLCISALFMAQGARSEGAAEANVLQKRLRLVGFIRVGASDKQSLVVLKTNDGGRTMILRPDDEIPGTAYHILRLHRDELIVRGPRGEETIPLESGAETIGAAPIASPETFTANENGLQTAEGEGTRREAIQEREAESPAVRKVGRIEVVSGAAKIEEVKLEPSSMPLERASMNSEMPCLDGRCGPDDEGH